MNRIFIAGDIHGDINNISNILNQIENPNREDKIIVCGDAGLEYGNIIMDSAKKAMNKFPGSWIIMRGNHDTRYWRDHKFSSDWYIKNNYLIQEKYPNIFYVKDEGGFYNINNYNFLFVPGAYSVDKQYRLQNFFPYEPEEQLTYKEKKDIIKIALENKNKIDFVIGHTFPLKMKPYYSKMFLNFINQKTVDNNQEKFLDILMEEIEQGKNFKHYFGGHFHGDMRMNKFYTMLYKTIAEIGD